MCAPVFASRRKSLPPLAELDACGDRCSPQRWRLKTFAKHDVNKRKEAARRDQYRSLIANYKRGT